MNCSKKNFSGWGRDITEYMNWVLPCELVEAKFLKYFSFC